VHSNRVVRAGVFFALVAFGISLSWPWLAERIEVNVAMLGEPVVDGVSFRVNPSAAPYTFGSSDAVTDGLYDSQHMFEFPSGAATHDFELRLPFVFNVRRLAVLGWGEQSNATLHIAVRTGDDPWRLVVSTPWRAEGQIPPLVQITGPFPLQSVRVSVSGADRVVLNTIACFVAMPRWLAWTYFLVLNVIGPALVGIAIVLVIVGWGRWLTYRIGACEMLLARRITAGLLFTATICVIWCMAPHFLLVNAGVLTLLGSGAVGEVVRILRRRALVSFAGDRADTLDVLPWSTLGWMFALVFLLLAQVLTDTYLLGNRRINPLDHLFGYLGAQRLNQGLPMPLDFYQRPWLIATLYAPLDTLSGRFSYWCFLGMMAGLNSLIVAALHLYCRRWGLGGTSRAAGLLVIAPIVGCFHFPGQRPFTAALALMAVGWWTASREAEPRRWLWGGLALSLAIGAHPSALFLLPGAVLYWLFLDPAPGLRTALCGAALPVGAYLAWLFFVHSSVGGYRNNLVFYPLMTTWYEPFPADWSVGDILRHLSADHWRQLAVSRLAHLRHYLWTDDFSRVEPRIDWLRWISLPNIFGFVMTATLLRPGHWFGRGWFVWLAIASPLLVHHAYIGMAQPQFHISPTPFFGVAVLLFSTVGCAAAQLSRRLWMAVVMEWGIRQFIPALRCVLDPTFRNESPLGSLSFFSVDYASYAVLAALAPILWIGCATAAFRLRD
jgi:hypothetical protein